MECGGDAAAARDRGTLTEALIADYGDRAPRLIGIRGAGHRVIRSWCFWGRFGWHGLEAGCGGGLGNMYSKPSQNLG
jgi:hypothetical protein